MMRTTIYFGFVIVLLLGIPFVSAGLGDDILEWFGFKRPQLSPEPINQIGVRVYCENDVSKATISWSGGSAPSGGRYWIAVAPGVHATHPTDYWDSYVSSSTTSVVVPTGGDRAFWHASSGTYFEQSGFTLQSGSTYSVWISNGANSQIIQFIASGCRVTPTVLTFCENDVSKATISWSGGGAPSGGRYWIAVAPGLYGTYPTDYWDSYVSSSTTSVVVPTGGERTFWHVKDGTYIQQGGFVLEPTKEYTYWVSNGVNSGRTHFRALICTQQLTPQPTPTPTTTATPPQIAPVNPPSLTPFCDGNVAKATISWSGGAAPSTGRYWIAVAPGSYTTEYPTDYWDTYVSSSTTSVVAPSGGERTFWHAKDGTYIGQSGLVLEGNKAYSFWVSNGVNSRMTSITTPICTQQPTQPTPTQNTPSVTPVNKPSVSLLCENGVSKATISWSGGAAPSTGRYWIAIAPGSHTTYPTDYWDTYVSSSTTSVVAPSGGERTFWHASSGTYIGQSGFTLQEGGAYSVWISNGVNSLLQTFTAMSCADIVSGRTGGEQGGEGTLPIVLNGYMISGALKDEVISYLQDKDPGMASNLETKFNARNIDVEFQISLLDYLYGVRGLLNTPRNAELGEKVLKELIVDDATLSSDLGSSAVQRVRELSNSMADTLQSRLSSGRIDAAFQETLVDFLFEKPGGFFGSQRDPGLARNIFRELKANGITTPPLTVSIGIVEGAYFQYDTCGGDDVTSWFDDANGRRINHCVRKSVGSPGKEYVTHVYFRDSAEGCGIVGDRVGSWFLDGKGAVVYQCVRKSSFSENTVFLTNVYVQYNGCGSDSVIGSFEDRNGRVIYYCISPPRDVQSPTPGTTTPTPTQFEISLAGFCSGTRVDLSWASINSVSGYNVVENNQVVKFVEQPSDVVIGQTLLSTSFEASVRSHTYYIDGGDEGLDANSNSVSVTCSGAEGSTTPPAPAVVDAGQLGYTCNDPAGRVFPTRPGRSNKDMILNPLSYDLIKKEKNTVTGNQGVGDFEVSDLCSPSGYDLQVPYCVGNALKYEILKCPENHICINDKNLGFWVGACRRCFNFWLFDYPFGCQKVLSGYSKYLEDVKRNL